MTRCKEWWVMKSKHIHQCYLEDEHAGAHLCKCKKIACKESGLNGNMIFGSEWFAIAYLVLLFLNAYTFVWFKKRQRKMHPERYKNEH